MATHVGASGHLDIVANGPNRRVHFSRLGQFDAVVQGVLPDHLGRRGTFNEYWKLDPKFARVKWDDFEENAAALAEQWGDNYVAEAREHGQLVQAGNIAKVGSAPLRM